MTVRFFCAWLSHRSNSSSKYLHANTHFRSIFTESVYTDYKVIITPSSIHLQSPLMYCLASFSTFCKRLTHTLSLLLSFGNISISSSKAFPPPAVMQSSPWSDFRNVAAQEDKTRSIVDLLNGVKLTSLQYCVYCATIRSGIIVLMRFGVLRRLPSSRESTFWPKRPKGQVYYYVWTGDKS